ncbi:PFL_4695 family integrating conjugative element protein [Stutzerimonas stutzeri]
MRYLLIIVLLIPGLCNAMTVVADHGGMPTKVFFKGMNSQQSGAAHRAPMRPSSGTVGLDQMLPIQSQLTPGRVAHQPVRLDSLPAPLFIVGDDSRSLAWLQQNVDVLVQIQAIGWAVNIRDKAALDRIRSAVPGLGVQPMHVDDFAARLGLKHYPALITRHAVEQ